jgi:CheY-like chemotaxis protein
VKKLALAMGGDVGLVSRPGFGASFWVELPLAAVPNAEPAPQLTGVRICVVSPSLLLTQTLRAVAISLGASPVERGDYADVVLLDWHDGIDGEEIDALRRSSRALIALAPQERRQIIEDCRAAGIEHYTLKPVRRGSLVERVRAALGEKPMQAETASDAPTPTQQPLLGLRVLLAEDNPINALLARTLLTRAGCSVTSAQDGEEAVAAASAAAFDLILLDFEAAQRIRAG